MATLHGLPILVFPTNSYQDYFARAETDTFYGCYASFLVPYSIDPSAAVAPAEVAQLIYAAAQQSIPTLLQAVA